MPANHADFLGRTRMLKALPSTVLAVLADCVREKSYAGGQTIFQRGDRGDDILFVKQGRVRLSVLSADGREFSFAHAAAGEEFGEIAALDGRPRSANAVALIDTVILHLPAASLYDSLDDNPHAARRVIAFLCERLRAVSDHLEDIALFSLDVRLARLLLHALGPGKGSGWHRIAITVSQSELALLLGASRQAVNEAFASLEALGARRRTDKRYELNVDALRAFAGLDSEERE